jgi:integrase/recombinase XerC
MDFLFSSNHFHWMKDQIDAFLDHLEHQNQYSKHTLTAYRTDLTAFADYMEVFYELDELSEVSRRMVSSFVASLAEQGLSARSINRKLSAVQSFFSHYVKRGELDQSPVKHIQRPKTPKRLPSIIRSEQVQQLLAKESFADDFEGARDRALISVFYACGLRREELIGMQLKDISWSVQQIKVLGKRNKERILPVAEELLVVLKEYLDFREELSPSVEEVFVTSKGEKLYPSLVYKTVKNYLSKVTTMDKKSPHVLRHTFATHLLNEGANLQSIKELLGHESLATTQVYTHTSLEKLKDIYKNAHPRSKKSN